jgi:hypothetical protein
MRGLKFELDIDAEIQKLEILPANSANSANQGEGISNSPILISCKSDRGKSIKEATDLFNKRGWIQIFSGYLSTNLYLVRNDKIKVPNSTFPKYTEKEIMTLHGLTLDELKTLHEAKVIFHGEIL